MKAMAYLNYVPGKNGYLCCACVERDQRQNDYPHLFFVTTQPKQVDAKCRCAKCGYEVGGHEARCAAERIAKLIRDTRQGEKKTRVVVVLRSPGHDDLKETEMKIDYMREARNLLTTPFPSEVWLDIFWPRASAEIRIAIIQASVDIVLGMANQISGKGRA